MNSPFARLSFFLLLILAGFSASAQDDDWDFEEETGEKKGKISGLMLHVPVTYQSLEIANLNSALYPNGGVSDVFTSDKLSLGIHGTFVVRNFVLTAGMDQTFRETSSTPTAKARYNLRQRKLGVGWNVYSNRGLIIYPTAHVGLYTHNLVIAENTADNGTVGVFAGDYSGTQLTKQGLYTGAEISVDYMTGFDEKSGAGITFGVKLGYNYQLSEGSWSSFGTDLGDDPNLDISGAYAKLCIAFAGWHRQ